MAANPEGKGPTRTSWRLPLCAGAALAAVGLGSFLAVAAGLGGGINLSLASKADSRGSLAQAAPKEPPATANVTAELAPVDLDAARDPLADRLYLTNFAPGLRSAPGASGRDLQRLHESLVHVRRGDTLMALLTRAGAQRTDAHAAIAALAEQYDPRKLRPGQEIQLAFSAQGEEAALEWLRLVPDATSEVHVQRDSAGYVALAVERPLAAQERYAEGRIDTSLFAAAAAKGVPHGILVDAIRAMSYDVDFQRDIQPGDGFELFYDSLTDESGATVKSGDLHYVALALGNRERAYYRFETEDGIVDFFDANGLSARRGLLRTPIDGARISSNFGMRRHPIKGYTRMHQGTDFAAPTGTPIYAAGDGVVEQAGRNGGYGNYIKVRHGNGYSTAYAHLSRFAKGLKSGSRVTQGDVIGYVGSTGASTGPHLHYEVHVNGEQVNPASIKLPTGRQLAGAEMELFDKRVQEINRKRLQQRQIQVASIEQRRQQLPQACGEGPDESTDASC
ncbi:M23 family metallopeptidase [Aquibaculum sediminis]|uniref:M23 family metallopeptidase n=2 Tax=Rhodovibrionaceae TaxID=2844403 RepID=UPI0034545660